MIDLQPFSIEAISGALLVTVGMALIGPKFGPAVAAAVVLALCVAAWGGLWFALLLGAVTQTTFLNVITDMQQGHLLVTISVTCASWLVVIWMARRILRDRLHGALIHGKIVSISWTGALLIASIKSKDAWSYDTLIVAMLTLGLGLCIAPALRI